MSVQATALATPLPQFDAVAIGDELPVLETPAIARSTLAYYAGASGDRNPMHIDIDFARAAGQEDVFAHGMLAMAYAGRVLTDWAGPLALREFGVRFVAITRLHERLRCRAHITAKIREHDENRVAVAVEVLNLAGETKLAGTAVLALP
jgi:acyl dehydratase